MSGRMMAAAVNSLRFLGNVKEFVVEFAARIEWNATRWGPGQERAKSK
jgi:hypothetical protein